MNRRTAVHTTAAAALGLAAGAAVAQQQTGPSSSASSYIVPVAPGVVARSLLTAGDSVPNLNGGAPYRMVGVPDGLGSYDNGDGTVTVLINHELGNTAGVTRAHGAAGSFISQFRIDRATGQVLGGKDLIQQVSTFNAATNAYNAPGSTAFNRLCSADLPAPTAFYNPATGLGTQTRLFMNGEESGNEGRGFAHIATGPNAGQSFELPRVGKFSHENSLASPSTGDRTVVIGLDDSTVNGQLYVYAGTKTNTGSEIDRAGLTNGSLFGIAVQGVANEDRATGIGGQRRFGLAPLGNTSTTTGAALDTASVAAGVTGFLRPEDGHFDPSSPNDFYFVTTDRLDQVNDGTGSQVGRSRLWRMRFDDIAQPELGGSVESLFDASAGPNMMDNITIDRYGHVLIQEDVGGAAHNGKIWQYDTATGALSLLAMHDAARFGDLAVAPTAPFTNDEESSGIIDASDLLGPGWFLLDVQAHYPIAGEIVEGGQLVAFFNPSSVPAAGPTGLVALAALAAARRRR